MPTAPTSNGSFFTSPVGSPSSKRKRDEHPILPVSKPSSLRRTTTSTPKPTTSSSEADSTRSHVTNQFKDLEITPTPGKDNIEAARVLQFRRAIPDSAEHLDIQRGGPSRTYRRASIKDEGLPHFDGGGSLGRSPTEISLSEFEGRREKRQRTNLQGAREIPETPGVREGINSDGRGDDNERPGVSFLQESPSLRRDAKQESVFGENGMSRRVGQRPGDRMQAEKNAKAQASPENQPFILSTPPKTAAASVMIEEDDRASVSNSPGPGSLHWDDSEITGHDPSDPEDDGEGINGIGFRPTPATMRDRSEKRRHQLEGYKSMQDREAREARAKRLAERRNGMNHGQMRSIGQGNKQGETDNEKEKERKVRFEAKERAVDVL